MGLLETLGLRTREEAPAPLIGAAEMIDVNKVEQMQRISMIDRSWQRRGWGYYNTVGEIHFAGRYVGGAISQLRLFGAEKPAQEIDANGKRQEPTVTKNEAVGKAVDNLKSAKGGQPALLRSLAINIFIVGETIMLGTEVDGVQSWEGLSIDELLTRPGDKTIYRRSTPNQPPVAVPKDSLLIRCWQEHPQFSGVADAALHSVLEECEKLLLLTRADKAAARSRFAGSGLLFIPNELVPVDQGPTEGQTELTPGMNPVLNQLAKAMIEPIKDESHPSAVVPVVLFGPAEYGQHIRYITFDRQMDRTSANRRIESIERIATALDLPSEILLGKAKLNHWTSWQISEETFKSHLQPFIELICDALTTGYLQPALIRAGMSADEAKKYVVWYDDSGLVTRTDKTELADRLFADNLISGAARRRELGFDEKDSMPDDEYAKRVGVLLGDPHLALTGEEAPPPPTAGPPGANPEGAPPNAVGDTSKDPSQASKPPPAVDKNAPSKPSPGSNGSKTSTVSDGRTLRKDPSNVTKGPAKSKQPKAGVTASGALEQEIGRQLAQLDVDLMVRLRSSADEVLESALNRAGARIRARAQASTVKDVIKDVPNALVASTLGGSVVASLNLTEHDLMQASFHDYSGKVALWLREAQAQRSRMVAEFARRHPGINTPDDFGEDTIDGVYGEQDKSNRELALAALVTGLLGLAAKRLYAPNTPVPPSGEVDSINVPASLVREVVDLAGGGTTGSTSGGIGTGRTAKDMFGGIGLRTVGYQWVYGVLPRRPFQSHESLDGVEFSSWNDEALAVAEEDSWLGVDHYQPGDHSGCLCAAAPIFADVPVPEDAAPDTVDA